MMTNFHHFIFWLNCPFNKLISRLSRNTIVKHCNRLSFIKNCSNFQENTLVLRKHGDKPNKGGREDTITWLNNLPWHLNEREIAFIKTKLIVKDIIRQDSIYVL